ncbi:MAG: histidine kinase [Pseudomonadota bacterium]
MAPDSSSLMSDCIKHPSKLILISIILGLALISISAIFSLYIPWLILIGVILLVAAFWKLWITYINPTQELHQWTQMIRAGDFKAEFSHYPYGEFNNIFKELQFIGEMLQSLSRDAEAQVQKHTSHIRQKTRSLSILYDVASSINLSRSVDSLLSQFLHTITELIDAQASVAYLVEEQEVELLTHINANEELISANSKLCLADSTKGTFNIKLIKCNDMMRQKYFNGEEIYLLVVPLQYQETLLGAYNFYLHKNSLDDFDDYVDLFTSIGRHLGAAIEKAHLDEETTSLSIMRERTHFANELHDSLAQTLTSIRFQVRVLDETLHQGDEAQTWTELEKIEASINEAHTEIRELIAHFRTPTVLASLIASVEQTIDRFRQVNDEIQVFFQNEWGDISLPAETDFHILRIIQESLTNIRKHSDAENVRIMLSARENGQCSVLIEDDGVGFSEPKTSIHIGEHVGLSIMADRAKRFGGILSIESEPGEGTRIVLEFDASNLNEKADNGLELTRTHH